MSTTLTNGLKLPDKGSVDWYADMQNNYSILDGAVGTIAEHTTQIAGKAPAVHTHGNITNDGKVGTTANLPLITGTGGAVQAGAFGNAANTFCEGNDSRLSDARTPVAHTHTKSDVTDLLNSNFIPSANNSYDLGSSSYQWKSVYAQSYYYNGVAWGLDQANVWTQNQTIASGSSDQCYYVKDTVYELGQTYSNGEHLGGLAIHDKNGTIVGLLDIVDRSYGYMEMRIRVQQKFDPNSNNRSTSGNILFNEMILGITSTKTNYIGFNADLWGANTYNLGTSTNKWKTLNGVNPGALSLPSNSYTGSIAITEIDRTGWVYDGTANSYSPPMDCWLSISNGGSITVWGINTAFGMKATDNIAIPLRQGETYNISLTNTPDFCRIYPCMGNV